jgi:hypothetical protein
MKTIALEQVDQRITEALKHQSREDPILLTEGSDALGLLLRLPEGTKDRDVDAAFWLEEPSGRVLVIIQAKHGQQLGSEAEMGQPVFGSCKGMMTIVSEDEEHLKDFEEYMK